MSELRKDLILLVVGAIIAATSSQLTTYIQAKNERSKLVLEKQIQIVREYSELLNTTILAIQQDLANARDEVSALRSRSNNGLKLIQSDFKKLISINESLSASVTKFESSLKLQKVLILALFDNRAEQAVLGFRLNDRDAPSEIGKAMDAWNSSDSPDERAKNGKVLLDVLDRRYSSLDKQLVELGNDENTLILKYASTLSK